MSRFEEGIEHFDEENLLDLVERMIRIPSHREEPAEEKQIAEFLAKEFEASGIRSELQQVDGERSNVIGKLGREVSGRSLMLNGHMDTVPPGQMKKPFTPKRSRGKLYGRGAVDMKGALGAMIYTAQLIEKSDVNLDGQLVVAGVVGEESGSPGTRYVVENGPAVDMAIVGEPTELKLAVAHKGIEWIKIELFGKSAHASVPQEGTNAIYRAADVIDALRDQLTSRLESRKNDLLGSPTFNVGVINGGSSPSIVPDSCVIKVDRRWIPEENVSTLYDDIEGILEDQKREHPDLKYRVSKAAEVGDFVHYPLNTDPGTPLVTTCRDALDDLGRSSEVSGVTYWSDAALLSEEAGTPSVVLGPGSIDQAHGPEEFVDIDQLCGAVEIYTKATLDLLD